MNWRWNFAGVLKEIVGFLQTCRFSGAKFAQFLKYFEYDVSHKRIWYALCLMLRFKLWSECIRQGPRVHAESITLDWRRKSAHATFHLSRAVQHFVDVDRPRVALTHTHCVTVPSRDPLKNNTIRASRRELTHTTVLLLVPKYSK